MLKIDGYQTFTAIYESANSAVYRAIRETDNQRVILKVLKQDYPTPAELTRYKQEYELTRTLNQEGVVKAYGLEKYQNAFVMFVEDFGGESLKILRQHHQFSLGEFLSIAIKISTSLGQIHFANIIHKDINPANIVLNPQTQQLKIIDLGISTRLTRENPTLRNPNVLEGTLPYISPEQTGRMNRSLDYRTDFYSLGVTFYEMLTGKLPFETEDDLELVHCHIAKQPILPSEINPLIPPVLANIVMKLMAKNAEDRYQSAWGLKADLENCLQKLQSTGNIDNFTLATQDISDKFQIPQKLYGREFEITTLLTAFERVSSPSSLLANKDFRGSELILIAGYSGIGKTALVKEIYKPITEKRGYFIAGKFDQFQRNIPYSAVVKALGELIRNLLTETEVELNKWQAKILASLGVNGKVIIDVIPELELIIGKQPAVPELGANESQNRFNFVFQNFIKVFTQPEHPLALFLDDLQWADGASLKLIQLLMSGDVQGLFLMGAYRDNEVSPAHPLILTLDEIAKNGAIIERVFLSPLDLVTISELIRDALKTTPEKVKSLAQLVLLKTGGNPFFINEFLRSLYTEELLKFNRISLSWDWDLDDIEKRDFTDNVVELMTGKIKRLPPETQDILKIGAAIGNQFDLPLVSAVESTGLRNIIDSLDRAVSENLVMPLDTRENIELALLKTPNYELPNYKFIHDRVQQAAYTLIPELEKPETHLKIGKQLLEKLSEQQREEKIFEIVNNLNLGKELITTKSERDALAKLNLLAGKKAKIATAYNAAVEYLNLGIKLLSADSWQSQYHLTLSLYSEAVEAAYLNGNYEEMEKWAEVVLKQAKTMLEKVKIYEVKIQTSMAKSQQLEAVKVGLEVLNLMGISLPKSPTPLDIQQALLETNTCLNGKTIDDLLNLPLATDPDHLAIMRILSSMGSSTYQAAPTLFPLIVLSLVTLSVKHGNSLFSPYGYASYGVILKGVLLEIDSGYNFGNLALILVNKLNALEFKTEINFIAGSCTVHGKVHAKETLSLLSEGYQSGLENGHLEYGGYAAMQKGQYSYFIGQELTELAREMAITSHSLAQLKQNNALIWNQIFQQTVLNLLETSNNPCYLLGAAYNEQTSLPMLKQANDRTGLHYFYVNKLILCYLFGDDQQALEHTMDAANYLDGVTAFLVESVFHFYDSLVRLIIYPFVPNAEQDCLLNKVQANQEKMQKWANHAPMNFQHKFDLVEAEKCRVFRQKLEAMDLYDRAISGAKENQFIQEEALANELAAKFYLNWGKEKIAKDYMQSAHYAYTLWGATAKVKDLEKKYPQLLTLTSTTPLIKGTRTTRKSSGVDSGDTLDLATVMKASQAISGEIVLDQLLVSLMKIIIQNAGAQSGYLVLETQGQLLIEASGVVNDDNITALQSIPLENHLPVTLVNYVARLKEDVVLKDATKEGNFVNDPYIITHQPQSILCTPLLNQGQLIGIVYLENNLTTGAFTPDRLEVIKLLSGQAAIALENARLYQTLENKVVERTAQLAEANQEISALNEKLQEENLRLSAELDVAKKLQEMVLPKPAELDAIEGLDIAGYMEPADEVGGDYYDVLLSEHGVKIAIGDVTGHGLESGVLMLMAQTAVRALKESNETDPVRFLDILNRTLYGNIERMNSDKNMTLAIIDYADGVVKLSGQHEEMIVVRADGVVEKFDTIDLGFPIGLDAEIADFIAQTTVQLNSQDIIILYTDGITEAENINQELYGLEKICQIVVKNRHLSAPDIRQSVIDDLRQFIGNQKVFDDITLVVLKQK
ncbi:Serine/threonine protein kinase [Planktothrix sp. PCC 11201]|uniref:SpoIIE family protein phosphatase n=1 Tax=Planktothrix sp. PCC 11201 TaxID=1729650 RepID=UPI000922A314|nr:SpoIIE family protein phosphatase [Planktothrix sp. PCC 11201]SKB12076.1 Serine/threonine protein kinase [Planktothrix sp. PCC 11201]